MSRRWIGVLLAVTSLALVSCAGGGGEAPLEELVLSDGVVTAAGSDDPFTGVGLAYHDGGETKAELTFVDGKLDGPVVLVNLDGSTFLEGQFADGAPAGEWTMHYPGGEVMGVMTYENGRPRTLASYDREGVRRRLAEMDDSGVNGRLSIWMGGPGDPPDVVSIENMMVVTDRGQEPFDVFFLHEFVHMTLPVDLRPLVPRTERRDSRTEAPKVIARVAPDYPPAAIEAGVEGVVMLSVRVNERGRVESAEVVESIPELDDAAVEAVLRWEFAPAMQGSVAVAAEIMLPVRFSLDEVSK